MCLIGLRFFHPSVRDIVTKNKKCSIFWAAVETCRQDEEGIWSITEKEKANECRFNAITLFGEAHTKSPGRGSYGEQAEGHAATALWS